MLKVDLREQKRSDKKTRVNASLNEDTHQKLKKLAISCDMTKTMLAASLIESCVNHVDIIEYYQRLYNKDEQYRVVPINQDGNITY